MNHLPTTLDCSNIESTTSSLESILGLNRQVIREVVESFNCDAYSRSHPHDHRHLKEILPDLLRDQGATVHNPDVVYWFHGTRVLAPDTILALGLLSLHQRIEQIWEDLFQLAQTWVNREEWQRFRTCVEKTDTIRSSVLHRQRISNTTDGGPHAVLIRDALIAPNRFNGVNYLSAPETIEDLCESFKSHYRHDLLDKFQKNSIPCIVKFEGRCRSNDLVGVALSYLWCSLHKEPCATCNTCFDGDMDSIPKTAIVRIDEWPNIAPSQA